MTARTTNRSRLAAYFLALLGMVTSLAAVAIAQVCPDPGPDIVVTGGYYPVQWNRPYPAVWTTINPFYPVLPTYNPEAAWQQDPSSFIDVTTLENPAAKIKIGKNMLAHVAARHLSSSSGDGSKFSAKYSEPIHLLALIAYTVTHDVPEVSIQNSRVLTYTAAIPDQVGTTRGSFGTSTNLVTVHVYNTGAYEGGMPVYITTNMYPGTPE